MASSLIPIAERLVAIRGILQENLPWSPFDFIRGISRDGDRALYVDQLTHAIDPGDDLRFIYCSPESEEFAVIAEKLAWDSGFFGYGVARLHGIFPLSSPFYRPREDYADILRGLITEAKKRDIKYLFAAVDPRDLAMLRALGPVGFSLIETRAYYHMDVQNYEYSERFAVRAATPSDIETLGHAARTMVNPYDRFHADPFIKPEDADRLMTKWVEASIIESFADVTIVPDAPHPTAFCTVKYHKDRWAVWGLKLSQPVFSAVSPEFKGWYRKIISEINYHLKEIGADHSVLITQITNNPVIWTWENLGYHFGRGEHIFRIVLD